jgi:intracellular septation protein
MRGGAAQELYQPAGVDRVVKLAVIKRFLIRSLIEFGPLVILFGVTRRWDIYAGTAAFMVALTLSVSASVWRERRIPLVPVASFGIVLVLGAMTLILEEEDFIMAMPTVMNGGGGLVLLGGLLTNRLFIKRVYADRIRLPDEAWRTISWRLVVYLGAMAVLNEVVRYYFTPDGWVAFKAFGLPILNLLFLASQYPLISRAEAT